MKDSSLDPDRARRTRLVSEQYRDDQRLQARYTVHRNFSTSQNEYLDWIFEQLRRYQPVSIFDLGCGPGYLWQHNIGRIPPEWRLCLGDRSPGMLAVAADHLNSVVNHKDYVRLEGERLPFSGAVFDAVLSSHVLHSVSDLTAVLGEVARVLGNGGRLFAATNGERHMYQFREAVRSCGIETSYFQFYHGFSLQNGSEILANFFEDVECIRFQDSLAVSEVDPLLAYAQSGIPKDEIEDQQPELDRLALYWQAVLEREGAIHIEKETGLFIAQR
jgi:ubiquinone/menaquinone biosynthesis C-methylase UbiE